MTDVAQLRRRFVSILSSAPCRKIDFWCGGLHVSGGNLMLVAHSLNSSGSGKHRGIGVRIEKMEQGAAAVYDQTINAIAVPRRSWAVADAFERLAVVHEAVHALRDAQGRTLSYDGRPYRPRAATDEAAAYVGGCLFNVYVQQETGKAASAAPAWLAKVKAPVHAVAYAVALRQSAKPAGSAIDRQDLTTLFQAVTASMKNYAGGIPRYYEFDGVPGLRGAKQH